MPTNKKNLKFWIRYIDLTNFEVVRLQSLLTKDSYSTTYIEVLFKDDEYKKLFAFGKFINNLIFDEG